jgi:transglutaminase-like putative cysteine protease
MDFSRRSLLRAVPGALAATALPRLAEAQQSTAFAPMPGAWRTFEMTTRVDVKPAAGKLQAWVPLPAMTDAEWIKPLGNTWTGSANMLTARREQKYGAEMLHAEWAAGDAKPFVEVISKFQTRDRAIDLSKPGAVTALTGDEHRLYTEATELMPTDGIVKETADKIVAGAANDLDKARRIYDWIVDNTFRNPKTRGCGIGDVSHMLKTGDFGGKCADLNALYVALARAVGLPARDVYGIRVAASKFGYKSLGTSSEVVSKAQHCRAEVYVTNFGWVPVDPADVRKVVLEEVAGGLPLTDPKVTAARKTLFGAWEMNWLAYNVAHDVALPGSTGPKLGFLMYPQAEVGGERLDPLDPDTFTYKITAKEITV